MGWSWTEGIPWPGFSGVLEILVLAAGFYFTIQFFRGTRGAQVLTGLVVVLLLFTILTRLFHMEALYWLLQRFSVYLAVALVIIFQPEIRRALAELGKQHVFGITAGERSLVDALVQATTLLSERKVGALIAVERQIGTRPIQETGKPIDGRVTPELLATIFHPHTPLHDGGVIIRDNRIVAAGCVFPLSQQDEATRTLGTRHRAAIGLTEESDAIVVVVSEETGTISIAFNGRLSRGIDEERLRRTLTSVLHRSKQKKSRLDRVRDRLTLSPAAAGPGDGSGEGEEDVHG
ncbi:MAG: TIGR00159 family protein [Lentisphaerae bacterium]|nr:TIGR00159 family protein [Lentisphaerota bacterium]